MVIEEQANKQAFKQDKPMLQGNTGLINGATDFFNNNSEATPKFGASNSYAGALQISLDVVLKPSHHL